MIHGTADTKVNISQTWALTKALVQAEVLFKQMIYPHGSHSLSSVREHLHKTMEKYFIKVRKIFLSTFHNIFQCLGTGLINPSLDQYQETDMLSSLLN